MATSNDICTMDAVTLASLIAESRPTFLFFFATW